MALKKIFKQHDRPLSIKEILDYGREIVDSLNQATVYRNINLLVDEEWLIKVFHPELGTLYERSGKDHHHHFHCRACKRTFELPAVL